MVRRILEKTIAPALEGTSISDGVITITQGNLLGVKQINGVDANRFSSNLTLFDDQESSTTFSGTLLGNATRDTTNKYIQLSDGVTPNNGTVRWKINPGDTWSLDFDLRIFDGTDLDHMWLGVYEDTATTSSTPASEDGGYKFIFGGSSSEIKITFNNTTLASASINVKDTDFKKVIINFAVGAISISYDGVNVLNYTELDERSQWYKVDTYFSFATNLVNSTNTTRVKDIKLYKIAESQWKFTADQSNNITYLNGNVGIGSLSPTALLHLASKTDAMLLIEADRDNSDSNNNPTIKITQDGGNTLFEYFLDSNDHIIFNHTSNATTKKFMEFSKTLNKLLFPDCTLNISNNIEVSGNIIGSSTQISGISTISASGDINTTGNFIINGQTVIDADKDLLNIGDLTMTGKIKIDNIGVVSDTEIYPNAFNTIMIYDDLLGSTTSFGTINGVGDRDTTNSRIILTESSTINNGGTIHWNINPGNAWCFEFDHFIGSGSGGHSLWVGFFENGHNHSDSSTADGGYKIVFDEVSDAYMLSFNGSILTSQSAVGAVDSAGWKRVHIKYNRGRISLVVDAKSYINYLDVQRSQAYKANTYIYVSAKNTTLTNDHFIKNIKLSKISEDKWLYTSFNSHADIFYLEGNVNIGKATGSEKFNVLGNADIDGHLNITGNFKVDDITIIDGTGNLFLTGALSGVTSITASEDINTAGGYKIDGNYVIDPDKNLNINTILNATSINANPGTIAIKDNLINPDLYNLLIIYDDQLPNTTNTGTLQNNASRETSTTPSLAYIQLLPNTINSNGSIIWNINPGNTWSLYFEFRIFDGSEFDHMWIGVYENLIDTNGEESDANGGYKIIFDNDNDVVIKFNGSTKTSGHYTPGLRNTNYLRCTAHFVRGRFSLNIEGEEVIDFTEPNEQLQWYKTNTYFGLCGASDSSGTKDNVRVKNIKLYKLSEGIWNFTNNTSNDIAYNNGNVNIGLFDSPNTQKLSVKGDLGIQDISTNTNYIRFNKDNPITTGGFLSYNGTTNLFNIGTRTSSSDTDIIILDPSTQRMGVKNNSPQEVLDVTGNIKSSNKMILNQTSSSYVENASQSILNSSVTVSGGGWFRIASNGSVSESANDGTKAYGRFTIIENTTSYYGTLNFCASCSYGKNPNISVLNGNSYTSNSIGTITKLRIVYNSTDLYEGFALDVYLAQDTTNISIALYDNEVSYLSNNWTLSNFTSAPALPIGFTSFEVDLTKQMLFGSFTSTGSLYLNASGDTVVNGDLDLTSTSATNKISNNIINNLLIGDIKTNVTQSSKIIHYEDSLHLSLSASQTDLTGYTQAIALTDALMSGMRLLVKVRVKGATSTGINIKLNNGTSYNISDTKLSSSGISTISAPANTIITHTFDLTDDITLPLPDSSTLKIWQPGTDTITEAQCWVFTSSSYSLDNEPKMSKQFYYNGINIGNTNPSSSNGGDELLVVENKDTDAYIKVSAGSTSNYYGGILFTEYDSYYGWGIRYSGSSESLTIDLQDATPTYTNVITIPRSGNLVINKDVDINGKIVDLFETKSGTVSSAGWYRIATNGTVSDGSSDGTKTCARFRVFCDTGSNHGVIEFIASTKYNYNPTITLLYANCENASGRIGKFEHIRIVDGDAVFEGSAIDIWISGSVTNPTVHMYDNNLNGTDKWTLQAFTLIDTDINHTLPTGYNQNCKLDLTGVPHFAIRTESATTFETRRDGSLLCSPDTDMVSTFGRAKIGYYGVADAVGFSHYDWFNSDSCAFKQTSGGKTVINAVSGQNIVFRINNSEIAFFDGSSDGDLNVGSGTFYVDISESRIGINDTSPSYDLDVNGTGRFVNLLNTNGGVTSGGTITTTGTNIISIANDQDVQNILGKAIIGDAGHDGWAGFCHKDSQGTGSYALIQSSDGITILNAADTKQIEFKINNSKKAQLSSNGDFFVDTDTLYVDASANSVGIRTTSPTKPLHIYEDSNNTTNCGILVEQDGDGDSSIHFLLTGGQQWTVGIDNTQGDRFSINDAGTLNASSQFYMVPGGELYLTQLFHPDGGISDVIETKSGTVSSAGWYRIATNGTVSDGSSDGTKACARFRVFCDTGSNHGVIEFIASNKYNYNPTITLLYANCENASGRIGKFEHIRIVDGDGVFEGSALDIWISGSVTSPTVHMYDNNLNGTDKWTLQAFTLIDTDINHTLPTGYNQNCKLDLTGVPHFAIRTESATTFETRRDGSLLCSPDTDMVSTFGRAKIGSISTDEASFGHFDYFGGNSNQAGFTQRSNGSLTIGSGGTNQDIFFIVNGTTKGWFSSDEFVSNGNIGVNNSSPVSMVDIKQQSDSSPNDLDFYDDAAIRIIRNGNTSARWTWHIDTNNHLVVCYNLAQKAWFHYNNATAGNLNFTGQHRCAPSDHITDEDIGLLVTIDKNAGLYNVDSTTYASIDESLVIIQKSNTYKDKCIYGVISGLEDDDGENRSYAIGALMTSVKKEDNVRRVKINGVGEGAVWICDQYGDIEAGSWFCSSDIKGYACRQDTDQYMNYTVGKTVEDVIFDKLKHCKKAKKVKMKTVSSTEKVKVYEDKQTEIKNTEIKLIDGKYVLEDVITYETEKVPVYDYYDLYDKHGNLLPEKHKVHREETQYIVKEVHDLDENGRYIFIDDDEKEETCEIRYIHKDGSKSSESEYRKELDNLKINVTLDGEDALLINYKNKTLTEHEKNIALDIINNEPDEMKRKRSNYAMMDDSRSVFCAYFIGCTYHCS